MTELTMAHASQSHLCPEPFDDVLWLVFFHSIFAKAMIDTHYQSPVLNIKCLYGFFSFDVIKIQLKHIY